MDRPIEDARIRIHTTRKAADTRVDVLRSDGGNSADVFINVFSENVVTLRANVTPRGVVIGASEPFFGRHTPAPTLKEYRLVEAALSEAGLEGPFHWTV